MSDRTDYTIRVFKLDKRCKSGEQFTKDYDYQEKDEKWMQEEIAELHHVLYPKTKYRLELHETYVERENLMSGEKYKERFDTPYYCSPSSETFWSM